MDRFPLPPTIVVSTRSSRLIGLPAYFSVAESAGLDGVDIDLAGRDWRVPVAPIAARSDATGMPAYSLWMPTVPAGPLGGWRRGHLLADTRALVAATGVGSVIVDRPRRGERSGAALFARELRAQLGPSVRLALAVRPRDLEGSRSHLAGLTALRRMAEEWDHDLALDLLGPIDPRWEAEAALARLLPRLAVLRIGPFESRPPGRGRARMTTRVLKAALESGYGGVLSLAVHPPALHGFWRPALAAASAEATRQVRARFATIHDDLPYDAYPESRPRY
jgi:hypothetical protein